MKDNPTISRIREARHRISEKCDHDPQKLVAYYIDLQKKHQNRLVNLTEIDKEHGIRPGQPAPDDNVASGVPR